MADLHELTPVLKAACAEAGFPADGAEIVRISENAIFRLPGHVVARISQPGSDRAAKEIRVAQWLAANGIPAVRPLTTEPVTIDSRSVTFWEELPPHTRGSPAGIAKTVRRLHQLPIPEDLHLSPLAPFVQLDERIDAATTLRPDDRDWLRSYIADLQQRFENHLPPGRPPCAIHGDPWGGNAIGLPDGTVVLLDLERFSTGPPEWDLIPTLMGHLHHRLVTETEYHDFCHTYGLDVTTWDGCELLLRIRESRSVCWFARQAAQTGNSAIQAEAELRLACIRGERGPRPWPWTPKL